MAMSQPRRPAPLADNGILNPISLNGIGNAAISGAFDLETSVYRLDVRLDQLEAAVNVIAARVGAKPAILAKPTIAQPAQPRALLTNGILNPISTNGLCNLVSGGSYEVADRLYQLATHLEQIAAGLTGISIATDPLARAMAPTHMAFAGS